MPYFVSVIDDTSGSATSHEVTDSNAFNDGLRADGHFVDTKEWLSGFWIIEAHDRDMALKLAAAGSRACNRRVEVLPFL